MIDLHTHSNVSDGDLSPDALVREAARRGLRAIALTDHDTIKGLENARIEAHRCSSAGQADIHFIPGIEISIQWHGEKSPREISGLGPGGEFHLLGLGIHSPSPAFLSAIADLSRRREERNRKILEKIREMGVDVSWEEVAAFSGGHSIGRPHFAAFLVNRKIARTREQAFDRYLGAGKPLYEPKAGLDFDEAVTIIRESGGIPVLAHPMSLFVAWGRLPALVNTLKERGLAGIEAWHPTAKLRSCRRLEELGKSLGLYVTEGSDYHGSFRPDRKLGYSHSGREIPDTVLAAIPELQK